jgi:hypothetical protein
MDPDLNKYDLESVTVHHPRMSAEEWQQCYRDVWDWYFTDEHLERVMRRNVAYGIKPARVWRLVTPLYPASKFEGLHPQQCGYLRRKDRTRRRPGLPREPALLFYPRHYWQTFLKYGRFAAYIIKTLKMQRRVDRDPAARTYMDLAITPVIDAESEALEMFELNDSSRAAVEKARKQTKLLHPEREAATPQ